VGKTGNPFLALGGLETASGVVGSAMSDSSTARALSDAGVGTYSLESDLAAGGPVLLITADGATPQSTLTSLDTVLVRLPHVLNKQQVAVNAPTRSLITLEVITRDTEPTHLRRLSYGALVLAIAVGPTRRVLCQRERDQEEPTQHGDS
jgi:hypothetical protein